MEDSSALVIISSVVLSPVKDLSGLNVCSVALYSIVKPDRSGRKGGRRRKFAIREWTKRILKTNRGAGSILDCFDFDAYLKSEPAAKGGLTISGLSHYLRGMVNGIEIASR